MAKSPAPKSAEPAPKPNPAKAAPPRQPMPMSMPGGARKGGKPKRPGATMMNLMLLGIMVTLAILAFPTFLLVCFTMLPSFAAYVADRSRRWSLTFSVAPPNLAAASIFIARLWTGSDNSTSAVLDMMFDPYVWCIVYLAAGAGWAVFYCMPIIITASKQYSLDRLRESLIDRAKELRDEWGEEIGPDDIEGDAAMPPSPGADKKSSRSVAGAAPARPA